MGCWVVIWIWGAQEGIATGAGHSIAGSGAGSRLWPRPQGTDFDAPPRVDRLGAGAAVGAGGVGAAGGTGAAVGSAAAGGTVGAVGATSAGGTVGAVGTGAAGGAVCAGAATGAGGTMAAGGTIGPLEAAAGAGITGAVGGVVTAGRAVVAGAAGGFVTSGTESEEAGQLEMDSPAGIVDGSGKLLLIVDDGGQAGIECSVGGSGGQMSVSSGIAPCAGATSS